MVSYSLVVWIRLSLWSTFNPFLMYRAIPNFCEIFFVLEWLLCMMSGKSNHFALSMCWIQLQLCSIKVTQLDSFYLSLSRSHQRAEHCWAKWELWTVCNSKSCEESCCNKKKCFGELSLMFWWCCCGQDWITTLYCTNSLNVLISLIATDFWAAAGSLL